MRAVLCIHVAVFLLIAGAGCAADLLTKSWMFDRLGLPPFGQTWWIWEGVFGFQTSLNQGALFGWGQGWNPLFAGLSILAAVGILIWLFYGGAARDLLLTVALGCIMGGILGNLYDRLGFHGVCAVRDFVRVMIGSWPWPNFNLADSLLVCGTALWIWHALRKKKETAPKPSVSAVSP